MNTPHLTRRVNAMGEILPAVAWQTIDTAPKDGTRAHWLDERNRIAAELADKWAIETADVAE